MASEAWFNISIFPRCPFDCCWWWQDDIFSLGCLFWLSFEGHGRNSSHPNHEEEFDIKITETTPFYIKIFCSVLSGQHLPSAIASGGNWGQSVFPTAKQIIWREREVMGSADVVGGFRILSFFNTLRGAPAVRGARATNHTQGSERCDSPEPA